MKHTIVILALMLAALNCTAQNYRIGGDAPKLGKGFTLLTEAPPKGHRTTLVVYYSTLNTACRKMLSMLNRAATQHKDSLNVILVVRTDDLKSQQGLAIENRAYTVMQATPRAVRSVDVRFIPFAYIADPRGRIMWSGNASYLTPQMISKYISDGTYKDSTLRSSTPRRTHR